MKAEGGVVQVSLNCRYVCQQPSHLASPPGAGFRRGIIGLGEEVDVEFDPGSVACSGNRVGVGGGEHDAGTCAQFVPIGDVDRDGGRDWLGAIVGKPGGKL